MTAKVSNIARNTSYFTAALIVQKAITFLYFIILARYFIPEALGKYYFAQSFTTIFSIFIDLGMANVLIREIAKLNSSNTEAGIPVLGENPKTNYVGEDCQSSINSLNNNDSTQKLLGAIIGIKIPLALISTLLVVLFVNILHYPALTKHLVYLSAICMVLDSFTLTIFSIIRGFHNLKFESISSVVYQLISMGFGVILLKFGFGLTWQMITSVMASTFNIVFAVILIKYKWKLKLRPKFDKKLFKKIVLLTLPFSLYAILQRVYAYLDSVILSLLAGDKSVGLYQVAFKIINALQFLPMAFAASVYPAFAAYWSKNRDQLSITFERSMNYLIIISLPISVGVIVLADKIILLFKTEYGASILPLQINMIALIFIFINFPIGALLNACDKQKVNTRNMAATLSVSILMNIILIPRLHAVGASLTVVFTNILMFILGIWHVPSITKYNYRNIILNFLKTAFASFLMACVILYLKNYFNLFIVVAIAGFIFFFFLFLFKGFKKEDIASILRSFKKEQN